MKEVFNIGVLGCAHIAARSVVPAIIELSDNFKLIGIASRSREKAVDFASRFQTKAFEGYQTLLDLFELQAVYIPLPNAMHTEWVEYALNRGLHVLVEKSLASDYQDVIRLNELARQKKLTLVENFQFRFHNQLDYIKELIDKGSIGELRCLRSSFGFPCLPDKNDIRYQKSLGGGALLDAGAYPLKMAQILLGPDIEVKAANLNYATDKEVDIWGGAYVKQKHGALFGELAFGFDHYYQCNIELWGSKGKIYTNRIFTANDAYEPIIELETKSGKETIKLPADHHFKNMLMHFYELITQQEDLEEEYRQNINQARLIQELIFKANE